MDATPQSRATSPEIRTIRDDPDLRISRLGGAGRNLVVAFSGIGRAGRAVQREEFLGTAWQGGANDVIFVADTRRSWLTGPGMIERICDTVHEVMAETGAERICTLGSSMGGHAAVLMSAYLPTRVAMAFAPQYSMDQRVIREHRYKRHRPQIGAHPHPDLRAAMSDATRYFIVFGAYTHDQKHRRAFARVPGARVFRIGGTKHNVARDIKADGNLGRLFEAMMKTDDDAVTAIIADSASRKRSWIPFYNHLPT